MNEPTPLTDDDLSAYLDGEVTDDLAARIEADADAQDRLAQLRGAAVSLSAQPVAPLAPSVVDDLIANALAAANTAPPPDGSDESDAGSSDATDPHPLAPPQPIRRGAPRWLVAAAIVVLMGIGLGFVWSGTHSDTTKPSDLATSAERAKPTESKSAADSDAAAGGDASASAAVPPHGGAGSTNSASSPSVTAKTPVIDLGAFATGDALRTALATSFPAQPVAPKPAVTVAALDRCAGLLQQVLPIAGAPTHVGVAAVAGKTVAVYEFVGAPDAATTKSSTTVPVATTLTVAVHPSACDQVIAFQR